MAEHEVFGKTAEGETVYRVKIALPNTNGIFKIGMPADGYLND